MLYAFSQPFCDVFIAFAQCSQIHRICTECFYWFLTFQTLVDYRGSLAACTCYMNTLGAGALIKNEILLSWYITLIREQINNQCFTATGMSKQVSLIFVITKSHHTCLQYGRKKTLRTQKTFFLKFRMQQVAHPFFRKYFGTICAFFGDDSTSAVNMLNFLLSHISVGGRLCTAMIFVESVRNTQWFTLNFLSFKQFFKVILRLYQLPLKYWQ